MHYQRFLLKKLIEEASKIRWELVLLLYLMQFNITKFLYLSGSSWSFRLVRYEACSNKAYRYKLSN